MNEYARSLSLDYAVAVEDRAVELLLRAKMVYLEAELSKVGEWVKGCVGAWVSERECEVRECVNEPGWDGV